MFQAYIIVSLVKHLQDIDNTIIKIACNNVYVSERHIEYSRSTCIDFFQILCFLY